MKTTLNFVAPRDLSIGTIRIQNKERFLADWIATPNNRTFSSENISPGIYWADIAPAGMAPQSVIFYVEAGKTNNVILPTFSALLSSGSKTTFFNSIKQQTETKVPPWFSSDVTALPLYKEWGSSGAAPVSEMIKTLPVAVSPDKRRISLGLSEEQGGRETFTLFRGESKMEITPDTGRARSRPLAGSSGAVNGSHRKSED